MKPLKILRAIGLLAGPLYAGLAFREGLDDNTVYLAVYSLVSATYFYAGGKAHSGIKAARRRRDQRR